MKSTHFAWAALALSTVALGACDSGAPAADAAADARSAGIEISDARLVMPPVAGNPAALYMEVKNTGAANVALRKAAVKGAGSTMIHNTFNSSGQMTMNEAGPLIIEPGKSASFTSGEQHVMVFDLDPSLKAGGTTEITLTIAGGKTSTGPVAIVGAGDAR